MQDAFHRDAATIRVIEELKRLYKTKILPLEQYYRFDLFHSPPLSDAEFDAKPQVIDLFFLRLYDHLFLNIRSC